MKRKHPAPEIGKTYFKYTVLAHDTQKRGDYYICRCVCGNIKSVDWYNLRKGFSKGCRQCRPPKPRTYHAGQKYGSWTILRPAETRKGCFYVCRCECGVEKEVMGNHLKTGASTGCNKCYGKRNSGSNNGRWKGWGDIPGLYWASVVTGAEARGLAVEVDIQAAWELLVTQGHRCALSGLPIWFNRSAERHHTASLDRIDSSLGYVPGNIQWVHKDVNQLKSNYSDEEFVYWCRAVARHQDSKGTAETTPSHVKLELAKHGESVGQAEAVVAA